MTQQRQQRDDRDEIVLRCTMRLPVINEDNLMSRSLGIQQAGAFILIIHTF